MESEAALTYLNALDNSVNGLGDQTQYNYPVAYWENWLKQVAGYDDFYKQMTDEEALEAAVDD